MARLFRKEGDAPRKSLWQRIKDVATTDVGVLVRGGVKDGSLEDLEEVLLAADFGVPKPGTDPAAVAFDAVDAGVTRGADVIIIDTAGRLHTSGGLMDEMK